WVDPLGLSCVPGDCPGKASQAPSTKQGAPEVPQAKPDFYVGPSGPDSTLPATGYRYMNLIDSDGQINKRSQAVLDSGEARLSYFGFEKFDTGDSATDAFQIRAPKHITNLDPESAWSDGRLRLKFDTLQLYRNGMPRVTIPYELGNKGPRLEPFTTAYPEYGKGGARQLIQKPNEIIDIYVDETTILPEK
uniref:hypothetical protein n=1 Tax=Pseudomonas psychrophila TaxID=122355 RepID=UPI001ED8DAA2